MDDPTPPQKRQPDPERLRLAEHRRHDANWRAWGAYLAERAWGTVREDYSADGDAWNAFPHDHARSRAYRWNEDGLLGVSDRKQHLCCALALWNGNDPILKERLFGLTGPEGNHGEDVKEVYAYLDATPTHSWLEGSYRYPQRAFPYADLVAENARRGGHDPEYELVDTGVFDDDRFFDVTARWAKAAEDDLLLEVEIVNCGPASAPWWLLPQLWFRNTWSWGYPAGPLGETPTRPRLQADGDDRILAEHPALGRWWLAAPGAEALLFSENESHAARLWGEPNRTPYVKDAFHRWLVQGHADAVNPERVGTKAAALYRGELAPGERTVIRLRLSAQRHDTPLEGFAALTARRRAEADAFYAPLLAGLEPEAARLRRQAFAGLIWSNQLYYYDVAQWRNGDPAGPPPPPERAGGRNRGWSHLHNFDVLSVPDAWEYPWYAGWDLAFHCVPYARIDPDFAKRQLALLTREWYMHPNGQLPAYEWAFSDANPPVHAWAAWRVYQIDREQRGSPDRAFLEGVFHKLLLNFTWWVNRKDADENDIFQGGFLGLDNISLFDRSAPLPTGGHLDQSDGTSWMAAYCLWMLRIALELAHEEPVYQDAASKFFEHFLAIARAMNDCGGKGFSLWNEADGFYYDALHLPDDRIVSLEVRSLVGLIPLVAATVLDAELLAAMPVFRRRMHWFLSHRPHLAGEMADVDSDGVGGCTLLALLPTARLERVLGTLLDEREFLSPYGIRSLSRYHAQHPYTFRDDAGEAFTIAYQPAESSSGLFGGNSNWRGPVWFPINHLLIEALRELHRYHGDAVQVEMPSGSGVRMTLAAVAEELERRLAALFLPDAEGRRPFSAGTSHAPEDARRARLRDDPLWRDLPLFHEYFDGDTGAGLGASHQTGWTALVALYLRAHDER